MSILNTTLELKRGKDGSILSEPSKWQPSEAVKDRTINIINDFQESDAIMTRPYAEFNDMSLSQRMSIDQKAFNTFQEAKSSDPDKRWMSNAVRPIVRNKVISIAAHVTTSLLFPQIYAQNENDEEDKDAGIVMRDLIEWTAERSKYDQSFLYGIIGALVNPGVILHTGYSETYRTIKEIDEKGGWESREVLDEVLSGFQDSIVPLNELYIADPYQSDIQKQGYLIRRRVIEYSVAEKKYANKPNFKTYVRPGWQTIFDQNSGSFYDEWDENLKDRLVEELIYYSRTEDLQIAVVNGIMLDDPDQPNPRDDKMYPFAKSGYELFDEGQFFYYKSLVNKIGPEKEIVDKLYRYIIDGAFIDRMPPMAVFGDEAVNSSIVTPGTVTYFKEKTTMQKIDAGGTSVNAERALDRVEGSIDESSQSPRQSGQEVKGTETLGEVRLLEQNARRLLGLFGKMIGFLVRDFGILRIGDIIQYMTVGQVMDLTTESGSLKFRTFIMPEKMIDGKKKTKKIVFDMNLPDTMTKTEKKKMGYKLLEKEGGIDSKTRIAMVNPALFRKSKYLITVVPELRSPESDTVRKLLDLETYDRAILNPVANQQTLYQDLLLKSNETTREDPDKFTISQQSQQLPQLVAGQQNNLGRKNIKLPQEKTI